MQAGGERMASTSEIRRRIGSVRQTQKITHAMYLISQAKLRKAKQELSNTRPYFDALQTEIGRVFNADAAVESRYLEPAQLPVKEVPLRPACLLWFTDLECSSFPDEPACPLLWAVWGQGGEQPPFGELLRLPAGA